MRTTPDRNTSEAADRIRIDRAVNALPRGADLTAARNAIETALRRYRTGDFTQSEIAERTAWEAAELVARSKGFTKLLDVLAQLGSDQLDPDPEWLSRLATDLRKLERTAPARAQFYRPRTQREHLIAALIDVWRHAGGRLSVSETGPLPRFLSAVLPRVSQKTLQRCITGEKIRRQGLTIERELLGAGAASLTIDESKIFIIKGAGSN
jgi:hypothetical protein